MANLSVRDEILKLANPAPIFKDPEDNSDDDTTARLDDHENNYTEGAVQESSDLRRRAANLIIETDKRYAGRKASRHDMQDTFDGQPNLNESNDESDSSEDDDDDSSSMSEYNFDDDNDVDKDDISAFQDKIGKEKTNSEFTFEDDGDFTKYDDDDDDDASDSGDDDEDNDDNNDDDESDIEDDMVEGTEDDGIVKFTSTTSDEVAKGEAAKHQLGIWDSLLEGRIKLQKAVAIINHLPQVSTWSQISQDSEEFTDEAAKTQQALKHLLDSLVHLQDLLLLQNTETTHIVGDAGTSDRQAAHTPVEEEDEEIPSDSDAEEALETKKKEALETKKKEEQVKLGNVRKRKLKMDEYPGFLKKRHEAFQSYRNETIQKWFDKTRLTAGKVKGKSFNAFDQSALAQINQIMGDKDRLIKRTQLKRSVYRVYGSTPKLEDPEYTPTDNNAEDRLEREHLKDYDEEIFDDDDFYHQILRELIEKKTSDMSDPVALSRQWLEIQKLRTKNKKNLDLKASKGRKMRYDVHKKMVNFMAPVENCEWSHEARDDLFKSLFGKRFGSMATL